MCGLFGGIAGRLVASEVEIVEELGIISQFRGNHSTGVACSTKGKKGKHNYHIYKRAYDSSGLFYSQEYANIRNKWDDVTAIIGHCRHATIGEINEENAHPYHIGHIIGAHNGTIPALAPVKDEGGTDSKKLYEMIAKDGVDKAIGSLEDGAWALTWFDLKENTLNILRNDKRPLYLCRVPGALYWASEREMLTFILQRNNQHNVSPVMLPVDTLHTFPVDSMTEKVRPVEGKKREFKPFYSNRYSQSGAASYEFINFNNDESDTDSAEDTTPPNQSVIKPADMRSDSALVDDNTPPVSEVQQPTPPFLHGGPSTSELCTPAFVTDSIGDKGVIVPWNDVFSMNFAKSRQWRLPVKIQPKSGDLHTKILRYLIMDAQGHPRYVHPNNVISRLEDGCIISKHKGSMFNDVVWINDLEYVLPSHANDPILHEYTTHAPIVGGLFYVPQSVLLKQSRDIRSSDNGAVDVH